MNRGCRDRSSRAARISAITFVRLASETDGALPDEAEDLVLGDRRWRLRQQELQQREGFRRQRHHFAFAQQLPGVLAELELAEPLSHAQGRLS